MIIDNRKPKECKSNAENNLCKESNYDNWQNRRRSEYTAKI